MKIYEPEYYGDFKCLAGECRHSCCIGWEIDIDGETMNKYAGLGGDVGRRIRDGIGEVDGVPCFKTCEGRRCAFLNRDGLCDIIIELGEGYLSDICREHPRFYNLFYDRREVGLGMCCEAAAELIIGRSEPFKLVCVDGDSEALDEWDERLLKMRGEILSLIADRELSLDERIARIDRDFGLDCYGRSIDEWCDFFESLEALDNELGQILEAIRDRREREEREILPRFIIPFEQILSYFIFRHLSAAEDEADARARIGFCLISLRMIRAATVARGASELSELADICRIYSAEIEYSEDNTEALIGEFAEF